MILQDIAVTITPENLPAEIKSGTRYGAGDMNLNVLMPQMNTEKINYNKITEKIITNIKLELLDKALQWSNGNRTKAAKHLGISRYKFIREEKKVKYSAA
jgi:DNA-binding protein Fis